MFFVFFVLIIHSHIVSLNTLSSSRVLLYEGALHIYYNERKFMENYILEIINYCWLKSHGMLTMQIH